MATIGQQLLQPEAGWRRYDNLDSRLKYSGGWGVSTTSTGWWALSDKFSKNFDTSISFKFFGSKFRIITGKMPDGGNVKIKVDEETYIYNAYGGTAIFQVLVFESLDLDLGNHTVTISKETNTQSEYYRIDAIDIDSDGYLLHPILNEKTTIEEMEVGDVIACRYTASSNGVGVFSELGTCTANEIPVGGAASTDGLFYFIHVGYDHKGRKKLVADRNIQHSISWDSLNAMGIIQGVNTEMDCPRPKNAYLMSEGSGTVLNDVMKQHNGTITGATWVDTPYGKGLLFGSSKYVTFTNKVVPIGAKSIRFKMKRSSVPTDYEIILANSSDERVTSGIYLQLFPNTGRLHCSLAKASGGYTYVFGINSPSSICDNKWHDILLTWDGTTNENGVKLYIDDMITPVVQKTATEIETNPPTHNLKISGPGGTTSSYHYKGELTRLEIYDHAIDLSQRKTYASYLNLLQGGVHPTDKENEWDYIIGKNTLNGLISAGDNSIWNWNGLASWTSTIVNGVDTNRVIRGNNTALTHSNLASNTANATTGFRPLILCEQLNQPPTDTIEVDRLTTNNEDVIISGEITDPEEDEVSYRILLNGVIIQDWIVGGTVYYPIEANSLNIGINTITLEYADMFNPIITKSWEITKTNILPIAQLSTENTIIHSNIVIVTGTISDEDEDQIQYRIKINDNIYQDWSELKSSPHIVYESIPHSNFIIGDNTLVFEIRDSHEQAGDSWTETITKTNTSPLNTLEVDRLMTYDESVILSGIISDLDGDKIKYRVIKNGVAGSWSNLINTPVELNIEFQSSDFIVGENTLLVEILDEFDWDNSANFVIRKKSLDSTYVNAGDPDVNYFNDTVLKINGEYITLIQMKIDESLGYLKSASMLLTITSQGTGNVKVAKILQPWDSTDVTYNTLPNIDTDKAVEHLVELGSTIELDVSHAGFYGVAIYSDDLQIEATYSGNTVTTIYQPTELNYPEEIFANKVDLSWKPVVIPDPISFVKTVIRRSKNSDFSGVSTTIDITNINVTHYIDSSLVTGEWYYRLEIEYQSSPDNIIALTNPIKIVSPIPGYRNVLIDGGYILKLTQGLALDDVTEDYNFYTTADKIKLRPLDMGTVIGGRYSDKIPFEVINTFEDLDVQVVITAYTSDDKEGKDIGNSALIPDYPEEKGHTLVEISDELSANFLDVITYPLTFNLLAGERKIVYVRIHPSIYGSIGTRSLKLRLVGNPL